VREMLRFCRQGVKGKAERPSILLSGTAFSRNGTHGSSPDSILIDIPCLLR
jgi:hypothetical protein